MRNLSLTSTQVTSLNDGNICDFAFDLDENCLFLVSLKDVPDEPGSRIQVWKTTSDAEQLVLPVQMAEFLSSEVVSVQVLPENRKLCLITREGDIKSLHFDTEEIEDEGSVETGILTASWSPDDSSLVLVTGNEKLILMTSEFEVISESPLNPTQFGEDAPISVGWGSKQTQFHGSLGKSAAQVSPTAIVRASPDDDLVPRISWRGDGSYFVVSASIQVEGHRRRTLRVYDRLAVLQSTSEPVGGLEHPLTWRPSGNLIASTQRFGFEGSEAGKPERHDVIFFERNGLRHGEFGLKLTSLSIESLESGRITDSGSPRWNYRVRELSWSSDSNVLAIWLEGKQCDIVQLWTTGNYHWYLKHEFVPPVESNGRFSALKWHPESSLRLVVTTPGHVIQRTYSWDTFASHGEPPNDTGTVGVLDGAEILLTPFKFQNVPPPMSSLKFAISRPQNSTATPIHVAFSLDKDFMAILWESSYAEVWKLQTRTNNGRGKAYDPVRLWSGNTGQEGKRQIYLSNLGDGDASFRIASLGSALLDENDKLDILDLEAGTVKDHETVQLNTRNGRLVESTTVMWQSCDGEIIEVNPQLSLIPTGATLPVFCFSARQIFRDSERQTFIGLANSGKLFVVWSDIPAQTLASNVNSFAIASGFVIYTTSAHEAIYVPLNSLCEISTVANIAPLVDKSEKRKVERGSRIVTAVPSTMSLILQMPRGNLETINPRPLVMEIVKQDLNAGNYRKALLSCRRHRIDLNIIAEYDLNVFLKNVASFVDQVDDVDYINLFLTNLGRGSRSVEKITELCDAVRVVLEKKNLRRYVNSILTAFVVKSPPDYEAALELLLRLKGEEPDIVEDAVKYVIFLVDAERLFDVALGMYDFSLVLMIAQHAQKDPREYLPFLRELRSLEKYYQRFKIDDHLARREKALKNLSLAGDERFEEVLAYAEQHRLFETLLAIYKDTSQYSEALNVYGDSLFERREFGLAALVFSEAEKYTKAMIAHEKALEWRELFDLAFRQNVHEDELVAMGKRVAEDLVSKKRYGEAARVQLDYCKDVLGAVIALIQGNKFSEARRIITLHSAPELLVDVVHPGALEARTQFAEEILEMRQQISKQASRLRELGLKKVEDSDAFYGAEETDLHNVDTMTDVSMPATAFTRYTIAPTTASRTSKKSSRSKRKAERKVGSGKKGTIDEEEYLLKSVTKLVERYQNTQVEVGGLLPHLFQLSPEHRAEGLALQNELKDLGTDLHKAVEEIWRPAEDALPQPDGWATRMEEITKERANSIDKIKKPELKGADWRTRLFDSHI